MHVHEAMVNVLGNYLKFAYITFKRRIETPSGAVNGNGELKKRLTQNILPDTIINAQDSGANSTILDFKSLCSTTSAYQHAEGKC
jgi:hypothetical protein